MSDDAEPSPEHALPPLTFLARQLTAEFPNVPLSRVTQSVEDAAEDLIPDPGHPDVDAATMRQQARNDLRAHEQRQVIAAGRGALKVVND